MKKGRFSKCTSDQPPSSIQPDRHEGPPSLRLIAPLCWVHICNRVAIERLTDPLYFSNMDQDSPN